MSAQATMSVNASTAPVMTAADVLEAVRKVAPGFAERQAQGEREARLAQETVEELDAAGVFRLAFPPQFNGIKVTALEHFNILREIARGDASAAWVCMVQHACGSIASMFPVEVAEEVLGGPWVGPRLANAGGPSRAHSGKARQVEGGWMISGKWPFATGCRHSSHVQLGCFHMEEDSPPAMAMLHKSQAIILDDWDTMAMRATGSNTVTVDGELFVPDSHFIPSYDLPLAMERVEAANAAQKPGGVHLAAVVGAGVFVGAAETALADYIRLVSKRAVAYTDYKKQSEAPGTHIIVGEVQVMISTALALIEKLCNLVDDLDKRGEQIPASHEQQFTAELAYVWRLCGDAVDMLFRSAGASAIMSSSPLQRAWRDLRGGMKHAFIYFDTFAEDLGRVLCGQAPFGAASKWITQKSDLKAVK